MHNRATHPSCPKCNGKTAHVLAPDSHRSSEYRMRPLGEIKKRVTGDIRKLNIRLLKVSNRLTIEAQNHDIAKTPQGRILIALFNKAVNTFRGIQMLKSERLIEESWVLLRVLLEARLNLIFFIQNDATKMTQRWADAAILEKLKYLREANFFEDTPVAHVKKSRRLGEV